MATFQTLPGFREFYPEELARRNFLFLRWRRAGRAAGFLEYDAPLVEPLDLYRAKSGDEVEGQIFHFVDKGGREVALRPEMTPSVCRLVGAKASSLKRPIKWFSIGEFFRYERAQKGRQRSFFQFNADIFGEPGPEAEIELVALLIQCFSDFGLTKDDFCVRLSDRTLWAHFLETLGFEAAAIPALLTAIDRQEKAGEAAFDDYAAAHGVPSPEQRAGIRELLSVRSRSALEEFFGRLVQGAGSAKLEPRLAEWRTLLDGLDAMGLSEFVAVDLGVVRGLAYYTGFVFEAFDRKGDLRALAGGGRYDDLVGKLGYADLPAAGFAIGDVTTALLLDQRGLLPPIASHPEVYCVIGGPAERRLALGDVQALRAAGYSVEYPLKDAQFGKQFKAAAESGARLALIYGSDETARGVIKLRDLTERTEREIPRKDAVAAVREALSAPGGPP